MNIFVEPKINDGLITHYHHFLFGYLLPLIQYENIYENNYYLKDCGKPMNKIILELPFNLKILEKNTKIDKIISHKGFDKYFEKINPKKIKNLLFKSLNIKNKNNNNNKILIIERGNPHEFYLKEKSLSGRDRRSVPNINEIYFALSKKNNVKKIILENMEIRKQMIEFKNHKIILLQHGAAMSNLLWCEPNSFVFEITNDLNNNYYDKLIKICKLNCKKIKQKNNHSPVEIKKILNLINKIFL